MEPFAVNTYFGSLVNYAVFLMAILVWTEHQRHLSSSGAKIAACAGHDVRNTHGRKESRRNRSRSTAVYIHSDSLRAALGRGFGFVVVVDCKIFETSP